MDAFTVLAATPLPNEGVLVTASAKYIVTALLKQHPVRSPASSVVLAGARQVEAAAAKAVLPWPTAAPATPAHGMSPHSSLTGPRELESRLQARVDEKLGAAQAKFSNGTSADDCKDLEQKLDARLDAGFEQMQTS